MLVDFGEYFKISFALRFPISPNTPLNLIASRLYLYLPLMCHDTVIVEYSSRFTAV